jgi:hypothetical protein
MSAGLEFDDINGSSGHSMRVGAAQDLLTMGQTPPPSCAPPLW